MPKIPTSTDKAPISLKTIGRIGAVAHLASKIIPGGSGVTSAVSSTAATTRVHTPKSGSSIGSELIKDAASFLNMADKATDSITSKIQGATSAAIKDVVDKGAKFTADASMAIAAAEIAAEIGAPMLEGRVKKLLENTKQKLQNALHKKPSMEPQKHAEIKKQSLDITAPIAQALATTQNPTQNSNPKPNKDYGWSPEGSKPKTQGRH